jgi:hypothetical protein
MNLTESISILSIVQQRFTYYFAATLHPIGIVLSCISLIIFSRPALNKTNMGYFYFWQTLVDIVLLLYIVFIIRSQLLFGYSLSNQHDALCKVIQLLRRFVLQASSWMSVFTTFDRFLYVYYPTKFQFMKKKINITLIILCMFALLCAINSPNLLFYLDYSTNNSSSVALTVLGSCRGAPVIQALTDLTSTVMRTWLPMLLMVTFDILIIRKMQSKNVKLKGHKSSSQNKENHYTRNVILLNVLFFVFNGPVAVGFLVETLRNYSTLVVLSTYNRAVFDMYFQIASNFSFAYQSVSFFINLIINNLYRTELFCLIKVRKQSTSEVRDQKTSTKL